MTIRQLEKQITQVDRKLLANRRVISHYFKTTMVPFFKQLSPLEITASVLCLTYLMRNKIKKYVLPALTQLSKKAFFSYLLLPHR